MLENLFLIMVSLTSRFKLLLLSSALRSTSPWLSCAAYETQKNQDLPSWVPDWTSPSVTGDILGFRKDEKYAATRGILPSIRFSFDGQTLHVVGKSVDTIKILGSTMTYQKTQLLEWEHVIESASSYFSVETYPTTLWRTLLADCHTMGAESD